MSSITAPIDVANGALQDEVEAITSIYDPDTIILTSTSFETTTAILKVPLHPFSFLITFSRDYPDSVPHVNGTQSTGSGGKGEGEAAVKVLRDVIARIWRPGQVCLFDVIEEVDPLLSSGRDNGEVKDASGHAEEERRSDTQPSALDICDLTAQDFTGISPPDWTLSDSVSEKKSTFIARCVKVSSRHEASSYIDHLISTNKKVASATHNITAWRIRHVENGTTVQDCDDDGETAAGGRVLHLMQLMDVWDVVVVVTRWYGGVQLGSDRFRIINAVAREALVRGGFVTEVEGSTKRKGRK